jgi:hypothetical protein
MSDKIILYRFVAEPHYVEAGDMSVLSKVSIMLKQYPVNRETSKGYWIFASYMRWVSKEAKKSFAYTSKERALLNFVKRTEKRVKLLKLYLQVSEMALAEIKKL